MNMEGNEDTDSHMLKGEKQHPMKRLHGSTKDMTSELSSPNRQTVVARYAKQEHIREDRDVHAQFYSEDKFEPHYTLSFRGSTLPVPDSNYKQSDTPKDAPKSNIEDKEECMVLHSDLTETGNVNCFMMNKDGTDNTSKVNRRCELRELTPKQMMNREGNQMAEKHFFRNRTSQNNDVVKLQIENKSLKEENIKLRNEIMRCKANFKHQLDVEKKKATKEKKQEITVLQELKTQHRYSNEQTRKYKRQAESLSLKLCQQERERYEREICSLSEQVQRLSELPNQAFKSENNYELIKRLEKELETKDVTVQTETQHRKRLEKKVYSMKIENVKRMEEAQLAHHIEKERQQSKIDQLTAKVDDMNIRNGKLRNALEQKDDEHAKQVSILNSELRSRLHSSKRELEKEQDKRIKVIKDKQEMDKEIYNMEIERSRQQERERYEREICSLSEQVQRLSELPNQAFELENNYELIKRLGEELEQKDVIVQTETQHRKQLEKRLSNMKIENDKRMEDAHLTHHKEKARNQSDIDQLTAKDDDLNRQCVKLKNALKQKDNEHAKQVRILNSELSRLHSSKQELETQQEKRVKGIMDELAMDKEMYNMEVERSRQQERQRYESEISKLNEQVQRLSELSDQVFASDNYELAKRLEKANGDLKDARRDLDVTKTRLDKLTGQKLTDNPNRADLSDKNRPSKLAERFTELYDNQWTDAFEIVDNGNEQDTIATLLDILNDTIMYCRKESDKRMGHLREVVVMSNSTTEKHLSEYIDIRLKECRKAAVEESGKHLYKKYIATLSSDVSRVQAFVKECFEVCWLMSIEGAPVVLGPEFKHGDPFNDDIYKAYTTSGPAVDYVVWPALYLYEGGPILSKGVAQGYGGTNKQT